MQKSILYSGIIIGAFLGLVLINSAFPQLAEATITIFKFKSLDCDDTCSITNGTDKLTISSKGSIFIIPSRIYSTMQTSQYCDFVGYVGCIATVTNTQEELGTTGKIKSVQIVSSSGNNNDINMKININGLDVGNTFTIPANSTDPGLYFYNINVPFNAGDKFALHIINYTNDLDAVNIGFVFSLT